MATEDKGAFDYMRQFALDLTYECNCSNCIVWFDEISTGVSYDRLETILNEMEDDDYGHGSQRVHRRYQELMNHD